MATPVNITAPEIENGSRIQLYNVTKSVSLYNDEPDLSASTFNTSVDLDSTNVDTGDTIRMRVTCQTTTTALLPLEVFGVINSAGLSFPQSQQTDTVYNNNNIDGSVFAGSGDTGTGGTGIIMNPDGNNIRIELSDVTAPYIITAQQIYNYSQYLQTTQTGIENFFGAITPLDALNYRINTSIVNMKIQNIGTNDVNLAGGRLYRDNDTSIVYTDSAQSYGTITHDTGFLLQFIQPQVEAALGDTVASATDMATVKSDVTAIKSNPNLNLIPTLL